MEFIFDDMSDQAIQADMDLASMEKFFDDARDFATARHKHDGSDPHKCYPTLNFAAKTIGKDFIDQVLEFAAHNPPTEENRYELTMFTARELFSIMLGMYWLAKSGAEVMDPLCTAGPEVDIDDV